MRDSIGSVVEGLISIRDRYKGSMLESDRELIAFVCNFLDKAFNPMDNPKELIGEEVEKDE